MFKVQICDKIKEKSDTNMKNLYSDHDRWNAQQTLLSWESTNTTETYNHSATMSNII